MYLPDDSQLCRDALAIWRSGVEAVRAERLVRGAIQFNGDILTICGHELRARPSGKIAVVGAGKAGAGMAAAVEQILGNDAVDRLVVGWVNVPADCVRPLRKIVLHPARPPGVNEPTAEGVIGSLKILEIVSGLTDNDLCLVLLSGGGSALLPAPAERLTLADKQAVTRFLMQSGATINELNTVRKRLSRIKGGQLARASRAGRLFSLIISDVVGDPLDVIASGPTVPDTTTAADALAVLHKFAARPPGVPQAVFDVIEVAARAAPETAPVPGRVENHVIGNNAVALAAAAETAARLGYRVESLGSANQGEAGQAGRELAERCLAIRTNLRCGEPFCLLSGGEPVVHLAKTDRPRKGGRNQQLALAALDRLLEDRMRGTVILSGGTDGEDGPTDAAGAFASSETIARARAMGLDPKEFLAINDAYHFFERTGGLIKTGPTHTNVMDVRVALVATNEWRFTSTSEAETEQLAGRLAEALEPGAVVALIGNLGAGKTRLVRSVAMALGVDRRAIASPTFVLVHEYDGRWPIYHFDTYRLKEARDFLNLGVDEYFQSGGICFVEWADRVLEHLPPDHLRVEITATGETTRQFTFRATGPKSAAVIARLAQSAR
ncbi:MAG: tRNA (adenosine(37)-N6)-threonylcarbamoyltransferase complex ATPase subunit type 1 TsaE [Deltaproteobacteria bacterium]